MTKEEYIKKIKEEDAWAPGWEAIDKEFARLYSEGEEAHYATALYARAWLGGTEYLDGYSVYKNKNGYFHLVTYGMSNLYADEEAFGAEYSGFGYEMTIRLKEERAEDCLWAMDMMSNLARYTNETGFYFKSGDFVIGNGTPIHIGTDSVTTGLVIVNDVGAKTLDTLHGKLEFLQLVGVTTQEISAIRKDRNNFEKLLALMRRDNPELITDTKRTKSYL